MALKLRNYWRGVTDNPQNDSYDDKEVIMAYPVGGIEHSELVSMVSRRLDKLAMCKRGVLHTERNEAIRKLGSQPYFTNEDKKKIKDGLASKIAKAMSPTVALVKKYNDDEALSEFLLDRARKVTEGAFVHPGLKKWKEGRDKLEQYFKEREAVLDSEFQDKKDEFVLGIRPITDLTKVMEELESQSW